LVPSKDWILPSRKLCFSDEIGHYTALRTAVDLTRRAGLGDAPFLQHGHAIGDRERLFLIVGHIDRREAVFLADAPDFGAHFEAQSGIEVGERLVEEDTAGAYNERAGQGDPLLLATGELGDLAFRIRPHLHGIQRRRDALANLRAWHTALFETEGDIFGDSHVRPEGVTLKHHSGVSLVGREICHVLIAKEDASSVRSVEPRDIAPAGLFFRHPLGPREKKASPGSMRNEMPSSAMV
jgi:hypothetical protein